MALAVDWAGGNRSWTNFGPHEPYTPAVVAVMDAQEVVKWTAVAVALAQIEAAVRSSGQPPEETR
jgi:hypothetical protein